MQHTNAQKHSKMIKIKYSILAIGIIASTQIFTQNTLPSTGNVGIGTTTPSALLDVNGNMVVDSSAIIKDSLDVKKNFKVEGDMRVKGKSVFVDVGKFKDNLVIDGITKMNGDAKVYGALKLKSEEDTSIAFTRLVGIKPGGKLVSFDFGIDLPPGPPTSNCTMVLPWSKANTLDQNAPANAVALCPSYGDLGIGNFNPQAKTHIYAQLKTGLIVETNHINDYAYGFTSKVDRDLTKAITVYNTSSSAETFKVNGNGEVYATKVIVQETPFPDYVFNKDYNLLSLTELDSYIKENKHLPNMPTAQEVEDNGADLGEINRVLVEKVEELTLHTITQQKQIDYLLNEMQKLKE